MRSFFRGLFKASLASLPVLALATSSVQAQELESIVGPAGRGLYVGVFGGGGAASDTNVTQSGYALFPNGGPPDGLGPLRVFAPGTLSGNGTGLVGFQIGKEWSGWSIGSCNSGWGLLPALEFEASYQRNTLEGDLVNPTPRLAAHEFRDTFPMNTGVFTTNVVLSLQTPLPRVHPYIGVGVGTAYTSIDGADSLQTEALEAGVNHFNSGPDASRWSFAMQAKTGCRFDITDRVWAFAEYRFQSIQSTDYTFGSTVYPGHAATTDWNVRLGAINSHFAVAGVGFSF
jgi:opacity protein-like surface antigen